MLFNPFLQFRDAAADVQLVVVNIKLQLSLYLDASLGNQPFRLLCLELDEANPCVFELLSLFGGAEARSGKELLPILAVLDLDLIADLSEEGHISFDDVFVFRLGHIDL